VIELPVAVRAQANQIVQSVHDADRCVEGEGRERALVTNLDVLVIPAAATPRWKRGEIVPPGILSQACVTASRMLGRIGDGADRL
jgi:hypothetical protein